MRKILQEPVLRKKNLYTSKMYKKRALNCFRALFLCGKRDLNPHVVANTRSLV